MISTLMPRGLSLDPAVNVALSHREELKAGAGSVKFGIRHWDGFTLNMVIRDERWKVAKIGETYLAENPTGTGTIGTSRRGRRARRTARDWGRGSAG